VVHSLQHFWDELSVTPTTCCMSTCHCSRVPPGDRQQFLVLCSIHLTYWCKLNCTLHRGIVCVKFRLMTAFIPLLGNYLKTQTDRWSAVLDEGPLYQGFFISINSEILEELLSKHSVVCCSKTRPYLLLTRCRWLCMCFICKEVFSSLIFGLVLMTSIYRCIRKA